MVVSKSKLEDGDRRWLARAAGEVAEMLKKLEVNEIIKILDFYDVSLLNPASLHTPLAREEEELIKRLVGENRVKSTILLKTKALIFAPSILAPSPRYLDYGTAIHRRFFIRGTWFSIIALNEAYLTSASELMLRYMIEHELAQGELYKALSEQRVRSPDREMKRLIYEKARLRAIQQSGIEEDELEKERQLILELCSKYPVIPVHFASAALFIYLDKNWATVKQFGVPSKDDMEEELAKTNFSAWADSSLELFRLFLKELRKELAMTGAEYGVEIV